MPWDAEGHKMNGDKFCTICGQQAMTECGKGHKIREERDDFGIEIRPNYCPECGEPYPWAP